MSSSAARALRILDVIGQAQAPLGVSEIGRRLSVAPGTVFRGLDALERAGLVARYQASARYVLGGMVKRLKQSLLAGFPIRDASLPYLRQLAFASGETVSLTVRLGWYALRIAAAPGVNEVTSSPPLGAVRMLADGCAGKAILAFLPREQARGFLPWAKRQGMPPQGGGKGLARELATIAARGFALEQTPFAGARAAVALPVRPMQQCLAAIAFEGPVLDLAQAQDHDGLARWMEIVRTLESLVRARPELAENPFDHLDADAVVLALSE